MKKKSAPETTKYFRFQFSKIIIAGCALTLVVCAIAIAVSVWRIYNNGGLHSFNDWLKFPFLIVISLAGAVLVSALMIKSQYIVDDKNFTTQFGLIKSKCALKSITSVVLDTDTNKLTVHTGENFIVISVQPSWNEAFVRALLKGNPDIDYSYTVKDNPSDDESIKK